MRENKSLLIKTSMTFGLSMGLYWLFKYIFFIWGFSSPMMGPIYWGLTLAVPFIAFRFTKQYRFVAGGKIGFFHAWQFGTLLYLFASLIVSLGHYIFYRYMAPPDLISNIVTQTIDTLKQAQVDIKAIESLESMHITPIQMTIQGIFSNVFYGIILSIPVAILVAHKQDPNVIIPADVNDNNS